MATLLFKPLQTSTQSIRNTALSISSSRCRFGAIKVPLTASRFAGTMTQAALRPPPPRNGTEPTPRDTQLKLDNIMKQLEDLPISWSSPGPAEFDFRSDVLTTPTLPMLRTIMTTTLLDDVYLEDPTTTTFESHIASLTGHEAGLLVLSCTMANQIALRTLLTQPPHSILADTRSHIVNWEAGGVASLCGAMVQAVAPRNGEWLSLEDVQKHAILSDDVHVAPTRVIALENTIAGLVHPLSSMREICTWARENGLRMHLDGARLWEAVAATTAPSTKTTATATLRAYTSQFDTVSLDFSKGLGAPLGAMILGSRETITRARRIRKSIGGGMRQAGVLSAAARCAVEETFFGSNAASSHRNSKNEGEVPGQKLRDVHARARRVAEMWTQRRGGKLLRRVETNLVYIDLRHAGISDETFCELGKKHGVKVAGPRIVLHYQISEEALRRIDALFGEVLGVIGKM